MRSALVVRERRGDVLAFENRLGVGALLDSEWFERCRLPLPQFVCHGTRQRRERFLGLALLRRLRQFLSGGDFPQLFVGQSLDRFRDALLDFGRRHPFDLRGEFGGLGFLLSLFLDRLCLR